MRYPHYEGTGDRLQKALVAAGYRNEDGTPDPGAFVRATGFDPRYLYPYLKGRTPTGERLERLVAALNITKSWLLHGEGAPPLARRLRKIVVGMLVAALVGQAPTLASGSGRSGITDHLWAELAIIGNLFAWLTQWAVAPFSSGTRCHDFAPFFPVRFSPDTGKCLTL